MKVQCFCCLAALGLGVVPASGQFIEVANETATRLDAPAGLGSNDPDEKDYAWGDVDNDGDIDLVNVRKQEWTTTGKRENVFLMNIDGVLTDQTAEYASASDVPGDQGFLTPTNDRDVQLVDVDLDGWLDIVTATTLTDNQAKHLSHPRVYMNLGEIDGVWQGWEYQDARIPQMHPNAGPRFCSVAVGDVTGDDYPDLWFGDYDSGPGQIFDFNNRLLINDGNGFFADESSSRMTGQMLLAAFGAAGEIDDFNDDGTNDILKQTSLVAPTHVAMINNAGNGVFDDYDILYDDAPYFVAKGDLNNDGKLDIVIVDDGTDRYFLNTGNGGDGNPNFTQFNFAASAGFGGNAICRDLNNDSWQDVIITDVDVDITGCARSTFIYRNLGNAPNVSMAKQTNVIPSNMLKGVHDVAVFDINGDNWLDLVMGRCSTTEIWMNVPPVGLVFHYPSGLPGTLTPGESTEVQVQFEVVGDAEVEPGSASIFMSVNDGPFVETPMSDLGNDLYSATLPALECTETLSFYFQGALDAGGSFTDPPSAPGSTFDAIAILGTDMVLREEFEADASGWSVENVDVEAGAWEQAEPNPTFFELDPPIIANPDADATQGAENVMCFVTGNGEPGEGPGVNDVDDGPTRLISPVLDFANTDGTITFARWFFSDGGGQHVPDFMTVDISNDGGDTWVPVPEMTTGNTGSAWETVFFVVSDYVAPTAEIRVRFSVSDLPNNSVTEGGIDNFQVDVFDCGDVANPCVFDLTEDGEVDVDDLVAMILDWDCQGEDCVGDVNGDNETDVDDLVELILNWGPCP